MSTVRRAFFGPRAREVMSDAEIECDITLQVIRQLQRTNPPAQLQILQHVAGFLDRVNHGRFENDGDDDDGTIPNVVGRRRDE